ncbi:hypothetical protein SAMN04487770_1354 [Butyrivibrio sp. ob235]|uniref:hypothetical protein n=1 Tax=Butyrivibrio sp. ob235 TaxID=1761780 RepID=UPI0008BA431A|nr:hypothetical protein [Butyrivibrio sp. ob235]SEM35457.1 hypothetical protein SAMN04487770_1354 [Butyrivibrio sp. ob235]
MKKKIRIIIDISMTVMMPLLMAYSLIGELFHEIAGSLIFILFIFLQNRCRYSMSLKDHERAILLTVHQYEPTEIKPHLLSTNFEEV